MPPPSLAGEPFAFQWHLTDACDQRCKHCYLYAEDVARRPAQMSWAQIEWTFARILEFCEAFGRRPYLYLTGGDPILHPDFWKLLALVHEGGYGVTVMGNPFHLTEESVARMRELGVVRYQLSLDGLEATHDWFRKPGSFRATLDAIPRLKAAGIRAIVMTTVSAANVDEIPRLIDVVVEAGADVFAFSRYCPTAGNKDVGIEPARYRELLAACDERFQWHEAHGAQTYFNRKDHLWTLYDYETGAFDPSDQPDDGLVRGGCHCGDCHLTITSEGDVMACRRVAGSVVGNVFEDRLQDLWLGPFERFRELGEFQKCSRCELLRFCRGCPAVAAGTSGSFYAPDPQCWKAVEGASVPEPTAEFEQTSAPEPVSI